MLALVYGMRRGEVLGLHWSALDWKAGTLGVTHGVKRPRHRLGGIRLQPARRKDRRLMPATTRKKTLRLRDGVMKRGTTTLPAV